MNILKKIWVCAIFVILIGLFNLICFWLSEKHTLSFYICIAFGNLSILMYAFSSFVLTKNKKYIYLDYQHALITMIYYLISIALNTWFILSKIENIKVNVITNTIILAIFLVILFYIFAVNVDAVQVSEKHSREMNLYYDIKDKAAGLLDKKINRKIYKKVESLVDRINTSQIYKSIDVSEIENEILSGVEKIMDLIKIEPDEQEIIEKITQTIALVEERDKIITQNLKRG